MGQPLSIEASEHVYLITTRTAGSRLWLLHNKILEQQILGCLARYQEIYGVIIYGFILMGNHYHLLARFPLKNRALFMRDFNSAVARLVGRHVNAHGRRSVWARRYAYQVVLNPEDVTQWFFYVALNPVSSGIVPSIKSYPSYNSFFDATEQKNRTYKWINWSQFLMKRRYNPELTEDDFAKEYTLTYSQLPEYERLAKADYDKTLQTELRIRESKLCKERKENNQGFLGLHNLRSQKVGDIPRTTKTSTRNSVRPLVLSLCQESKRLFIEAYFAIKDIFAQASYRFRKGDLSIIFPQGTYPPPRLSVA